MYDIVGKIWGFIFGITILFLGTMTVYANKQDAIVQNYVDSATQEFVDISRSSGQITEEQYEQFIKKLDATNNVYSVDIVHYKEKTTSIPDRGKTSYEVYFDAHDKIEILNELGSKKGRYKLTNGDYLRVTVENMRTTFGRQMLGFFIGRPTTKGGQIYASYGGYIGNNAR